MPIVKSDYQRQLENEGETNADDDENTHKKKEMRYWSDFNRVYCIPRSIQQVSELPDWEANNGNWQYGKDVFDRYEAVSKYLLTRNTRLNWPYAGQ